MEQTYIMLKPDALKRGLTGEILYPMIRIQNAEATPEVTAAADDFFAFPQSDEAMAIFENYMFISNK